MPTLDSLFTKKGKVQWQYVPFVLGMFPNAKEAAEGAICAAEQGKFWPMHDKLYQHRKAWMAAKAPTVIVARLASEAGLEPRAYGQCVKGKAVSETLARNNALAQAMLVRGTPTFVINGEIVPGALPKDVFVRGLDAVHAAVTKSPQRTR
jgi:protein-disulfide isomerase